MPAPQTEASKPSNLSQQVKDLTAKLEAEQKAHEKTKTKFANAVMLIRQMNTKVDLLATDFAVYAQQVDAANANIDAPAPQAGGTPEKPRAARGRRLKKTDEAEAPATPPPPPPGPETV